MHPETRRFLLVMAVTFGSILLVGLVGGLYYVLR